MQLHEHSITLIACLFLESVDGKRGRSQWLTMHSKLPIYVSSPSFFECHFVPGKTILICRSSTPRIARLPASGKLCSFSDASRNIPTKVGYFIGP